MRGLGLRHCKDSASPSRFPPSMHARSRAHTLYALLLFCDLSSSDTLQPEFADSLHPRSRLRISRSLLQKPRLPRCCFCGRLGVLGGLGWSKLGLGLGNPGGVRSVGLGVFFCSVSLGERSSLAGDRFSSDGKWIQVMAGTVLERGHLLDATALVRTDFHFGTGLVIPWPRGCQAAAYRENEPVNILLHMFQKFAEVGFQMSGSSQLTRLFQLPDFLPSVF